MNSAFWTHARPYWPRFAFGFVLLLATNALSLWVPWILRDAIEAIEQGCSMSQLAQFAGLMAVIALAQGVVRFASRLQILGASRRIVCDLRSVFFDRLLAQDAAFYDEYRTGDVMSRGVNDLRLIRSFYGPGVLNLANTAIVYVAALVLLIRIDFTLTLASLALYPLMFFAVNRISRRVYSRSLAVQEQLATISNHAQENLSGIQQVKTYVQEEREIAHFSALCDEFRTRNLSMAAMRGAMLSLIGIVGGVGTLIVLWIGGQHVISGRISFGDFVAFNAYLGLATWPTIALGWIINVFQRGQGAMHRLEEVMHRTPAIAPSPDDEPAIEGGRIEFKNLTFRHAVADRDALSSVDLTIEKGETVAFVGPVGAGKSTLVNLLTRVYPVEPGQLFVGGQDVASLPAAAVRAAIGYVPQEAFLFARSLRENIAMGTDDPTPERVEQAVRAAHLTRDLAEFPKGLDTVVGERGFTLSGGQRQRVTLARALIRRPRILILDDSLSAVDSDTERAILAELREQMAGRTAIVISHRISAVVDVDRIFVLDEGRVVQSGTHRELMGQDGLYLTMFRKHQLTEQLDSP